MIHAIHMHYLVLFVFLPIAISKAVDAPHQIPPCPLGSRPLLRPDGLPRKCLPHQNSLCVNALPDKPNADTVCCYNNQVDYYCCLDATEEQCPDYHQVRNEGGLLVRHNNR
uniref:WAP domain-containing protein n=1 Tax=Heterorhabditis bacteriophora TaxID=37862 RepID=A0A1I7WCV8_HETBA